MGLGAPELILIAAVILLLFGGKKLPELMRGLGKGAREFKEAKDGVTEQVSSAMKQEEKIPVVEKA